MMYLKYLSYLLRHKWFVFVECCRDGLPIRGITHDLSKFLPSEFIPYARWFFGEMGYKFMKTEIDDFRYWMNNEHKKVREAFDLAWLKHQKRNPHHWQYWLLRKDSGEECVFEMPEKLCREMVADWRGAGRAQGHGDDVKEWYLKNKWKMKLGSRTRARVEFYIGLVCDEVV